MTRFVRRRSSLGAVALVTLAACGGAAAPAPAPGARPAPGLRPATRAERTSYAETSTHGDVITFLDSLSLLGATFHRGSLARSTLGRDVPWVVASRPLVRSAGEARALGRPIVFVQGNIHGGEIEGKEALLALLRDLLADPKPNVLDSIVLVAVPIYNPDGNDRLGPQEKNRGEQHGPASIGERANGQGLDLNRDYVKAEAPETRGALRFFEEWSPDLFVDLHTTNGSYHGYALTYAPSLVPAAGMAGIAEGGAWARDVLLPELRRRVRTRHRVETFDYGNFSLQYGADVNTDTTKEAWYSYDHRPRFGTNYYGLRGGVAVLAEAYSHDPLERRVHATRVFVRELLSLAAEHGTRLTSRGAAPPPSGAPVPIRAVLTRSPDIGDVIAEDLARTDDPALVTEPGVPPGLRRTGRFRTLRIPVHDRFDATVTRPAPAAYLLGAADTAAVRLLRLHGIRVDSIPAPRAAELEIFRADSVSVAPRVFQGHREVRLDGGYRHTSGTLPAGAWLVPVAQPLGLLAIYLLEPESDDGLITWGMLPVERAAVRVR